MELVETVRLSEIIATIFYTFLGFGLFLSCYWLLEKITHFSLHQELVEKQNVAMAIVIGSAAIALALIIGNVIR